MKIKKINKLTESYDRYDLEIADNHNFFANEVLVHNCRCIATFVDGKVRLTSREGEDYVSVPHVNSYLQAFFEKNPDAVLDGELFNYELSQFLNKISSILRRKENLTEDFLAESEKTIRFYLYDGYGFNEHTAVTPYALRYADINRIVADYPKYLRKIDCHVVNNEEEALVKYDEYVAAGQEGAMLRNMSMPYKPGYRSYDLLKIKPTDDKEFLCVDIGEGDGNRSGVAARMWLVDEKGDKFKASFKGGDGAVELFREVLKNKDKYIGKYVTIFFNGYTGKNKVPNYGQFDIHNSKVLDKKPE